jgi:anti-sigma factor RsiW
MTGPGSLTPETHPSEELLIAYLTADLPEEEQRGIDGHLDTCDACLNALLTIHPRIAVVSELALAVPPSVVERVHAAYGRVAEPQTNKIAQPDSWAQDFVPAPEVGRGGTESRRQPLLSRVLAVLFKLPVLIPVSLAAGALLFIATQTWRNSASQRVLTRAVPISQRAPVTAGETLVRAQAGPEGTVIAKLHRGDVVEIQDETRESYRVVLPDGRQGWVERRAFE